MPVVTNSLEITSCPPHYCRLSSVSRYILGVAYSSIAWVIQSKKNFRLNRVLPGVGLEELWLVGQRERLVHGRLEGVGRRAAQAQRRLRPLEEGVLLPAHHGRGGGSGRQGALVGVLVVHVHPLQELMRVHKIRGASSGQAGCFIK